LERFDVVVVGAGTGGCMAAWVTAKAGLNVCLIDRRREEEVGRKVCGNVIGKHHFDNLNLPHPHGEELEQVVKGIRIYSPDLKTVFIVAEEGAHGFVVNRPRFGKRLLQYAVQAGATFLPSTQAIKPIIREGFVVGVSCRNLETGERIALEGSVTVDASGFTAVIRRKLPPEIGVDTTFQWEDAVACYREIRELPEGADRPDLFEMFLSQKVAPGGYYWVIPGGGLKVNVGIGVAVVQGFPNPREQLYRHVLSTPRFWGSRLIEGGAWYVPTRRPLDSMAGNGVIVVGDAACQANPLHGGGIGPSMMGGFLGGRVIVDALQRGDVSVHGLWRYNVDYMRSYGAKQAALDVPRLFLQRLGDEDLNFIMRHRLVTEGDLLVMGKRGRVRLHLTDAIRRIFRGLGKMSFLKRLRMVAQLSREARALYEGYPTSPEGLDTWRAKAHGLFQVAKQI